MIERRMVPWLAGLVAVALATCAAALGMLWLAAGYQMAVDDFYSSQNGTGEMLSDEVYREWNTVSENAYTLQQLSAPLLVVCALTVFAFIAVLARRWDLSRQPVRPQDGQPQAEAPAAS